MIPAAVRASELNDVLACLASRVTHFAVLDDLDRAIWHACHYMQTVLPWAASVGADVGWVGEQMRFDQSGPVVDRVGHGLVGHA